MKVKITDQQLIKEWEITPSITKIAKKFDMSQRNLNYRVTRLRSQGVNLNSPDPRSKFWGENGPTWGNFDGLDDHPGMIDLKVKDGVVMIGSDSHYWPGIISTAHRGFVHLAKKLQPVIVIKNGDEMDFPKLSRFAPIGWENRPNVVNEIEAAQARLTEIERAAPNAVRCWPVGNHDCLDSETELLTRRGWVRHEDIKTDDLVFSMIDETRKAEWTPINEVVRFPFDGELVSVEMSKISMRMTPNHRVPCYRLNWRTGKVEIFEYRRADSLPYGASIPMCGEIESQEYPLTDDQLRLAGWILTDGSIAPYNSLTLFQSKEKGINEIDTLLARMGIAANRRVRRRAITQVCGRILKQAPLDSVEWLISGEHGKAIKKWLPQKAVMPDWAQCLSARQFQILLEAIIAGDGTWDGVVKARRCAVIYGRKPFLDSLQALTVQHGWRSRIYVDTRGNTRLWVNRQQTFRFERPNVKREHYAGTVWCLRVSHENFLVRRNGAAYFTGNSRFETKLATIAPEYAHIHGVHLKDHFPFWRPCWAVQLNDDTIVKHRYKSGVHATYNNTLHSGKTIITGHLHALKVTPHSDYKGTRFGVDCGSLADPYGPQFYNYTELNPLSWRSGFVVLTFKDGVLLWPEIAFVRSEGVLDFRGELISV